MKHILNRRIARGLVKEETETKARYQALGKSYKIPALTHAGTQEGQHARLFRRLERRFK